MSKVFVVDVNRQALPPVHPGYARLMLTQGKAAVLRRYPFTLILKGVIEQPPIQPLRLKIDPGSKTTGLAIVNDATGEIIFAAELIHRGQQIKEDLATRRAARRGRRQRQTRYRKPRFQNRSRRKGRLAPSLESRIINIVAWVNRLLRVCPLTAISQELVRFDLQKKENPETVGLPVEVGTGGRTKFNRVNRDLEKTHWADAACVGASTPERLHVRGIIPLTITATGSGCRRMCNVNAIGFPCSKPKGVKKVKGFQTGDMVRAVVESGKKQGVYVGWVLVRASGFFDIRTASRRVEGINHRFCRPVHRCDGYRYQHRAGHSSPCL